jgi:hypothetical protein
LWVAVVFHICTNLWRELFSVPKNPTGEWLPLVLQPLTLILAKVGTLLLSHPSSTVLGKMARSSWDNQLSKSDGWIAYANERQLEDKSILRRLGLVISYVIAGGYMLSILMPSFYCFSHGCRGPGELDAFMPAFLFTPVGAIATAFSLHNSIQHIRKRHFSWVFWPLAVIFSTVLLGVFALTAWVIYHTAFRR